MDSVFQHTQIHFSDSSLMYLVIICEALLIQVCALDSSHYFIEGALWQFTEGATALNVTLTLTEVPTWSKDWVRQILSYSMEDTVDETKNIMILQTLFR